MSAIFTVTQNLISLFKAKDIKLSLPNLKGLAEITASMSLNLTSNTSVIANSLIFDYKNKDSEQRKVLRHLNSDFNNFSVWKNFISDFKTEDSIVLSIDQSEIGHNYAILMISMNYQQRAIPIHWLVKEGKANIGFNDYKHILTEIYNYFNEFHKDKKVILMADRFYACYELVSWLNQSNFDYRLRLKSNVLVENSKSITKISDLQKLTKFSEDNVDIFGLKTNLSWVSSENHPEGWAIISKTTSGEKTAQDYSKRWSIECMFSDFKSRGFEIRKTQIKKAIRLERMILFISIAFWIFKQKKSKA